VRATRLPAATPTPAAPDGVSLDGAAFRAAVARAQEHIAAGDIFQVVLARRFRKRTTASPSALYRALRRINPSPYMVLLELPGVALVGASPEALVTKHGTRVVTRPIAGTRRRGRDAAEEAALEAELTTDPKERAEHVMLVDLGRNDLGRVCAPGTVEVTSFAEVERYSHVLHLVSSVAGELAPGRSALDVLAAAFPAGTVSGAPKIRAIEILDELEPEARGFYAGATGYLSFSGDLDACITIRTLFVRETEAGREVSVTAGAGIVADSRPELEEKETVNKAAGMLAAVALAEALEEEA
jgi:anthranilate synthase component 1